MPSWVRFGCLIWSIVGGRFTVRSPGVRRLASEERAARPEAEFAKGGG